MTFRPGSRTGNAAGEIRSPTADWTDVAQLDLTNRAMRSEMIRALRWWVEQANVDGFRFDAAWNVPPDFFAQDEWSWKG